MLIKKTMETIFKMTNLELTFGHSGWLSEHIQTEQNIVNFFLRTKFGKQIFPAGNWTRV